MTETLIRLYELQVLDSRLDELIANRGELPFRVAEMRDELRDREAYLADKQDRMAFLQSEDRRLVHETDDLRARLERYKSQQYEVKTTREYDAISFQIEDAAVRIDRNIEALDEIAFEIQQLGEEIDGFSAELEQIRTEFADNEKLLNELLAETAEEEARLTKEREKIYEQVTEPYRSMYERIRPAKDGIAVVSVRGGACGGCYNAIPRQLVMELRRGDKHTVCESCGRIIVGDTIAVAVEGEPEPVSYETDSADNEE